MPPYRRQLVMASHSMVMSNLLGALLELNDTQLCEYR